MSFKHQNQIGLHLLIRHQAVVAQFDSCQSLIVLFAEAKLLAELESDCLASSDMQLVSTVIKLQKRLELGNKTTCAIDEHNNSNCVGSWH